MASGRKIQNIEGYACLRSVPLAVPYLNELGAHYAAAWFTLLLAITTKAVRTDKYISNVIYV